MSPTDVERESCAHCPNPNDGNDDWCTGGNSCRLIPFFTGGFFNGLQSNKFCVSSKYYISMHFNHSWHSKGNKAGKLAVKYPIHNFENSP